MNEKMWQSSKVKRVRWVNQLQKHEYWETLPHGKEMWGNQILDTLEQRCICMCNNNNNLMDLMTL